MKSTSYYYIILLFAVVFLLAPVRTESAAIETDFGRYQLQVTKFSKREFISISEAGRIVFGKKAKSEGFNVGHDDSKLRFLPGSFFFTFEEAGLTSAYQMLYPAVINLRKSSELMIPLDEFASTLSSNKFEYRQNGNNYFLKRLPHYISELRSIRDVVDNEKSVNVRDSESAANYALLNPLHRAKRVRTTNSTVKGFERYYIPQEVEQLSIPKNAIPVFENGVMTYEVEAGGKEPKGGARNTIETQLRMGDDTRDSIKPPDVRYVIPKEIYRREIEELKKKGNR